MLKTIFKTLLLFILMFVPSFVGAAESTITVNLSKTNVAGDEKIDQSKGHRMPPRPIVGIINVNAGMIDYSADLGEDVEAYEVWTVDGSAVIASSSTNPNLWTSSRLMQAGNYRYALPSHPMPL